MSARSQIRFGAVAVSLALHELATNALKYGALSNDEGFVDLQWEHVDHNGTPAVKLWWREHKGPSVEAPTHQGFGTALLRRTFGASVFLDYAIPGVACRLDIHLS
jgi:two-component sensor histidine kinase